MIIKEIIIKPFILHFRQPFEIAYEKADTAKVVIIKVTDKEGNWALGSAAPDKEVTGEEISGVLKILRKKLTKKFFSLPVPQWYRYHEKIQKTFLGFPSAQSAVEEVILNLFSKKSKVSLSDFFGGWRKDCPIAVSIGIKSLKETVKEIKQRIKEDFKIIKLKCGLNINEDVEKVLAVKKILPKNIKLVLDVNQGYSFTEAKKFLTAIKNLDIGFVEQPISAKNLSGLKNLSRLTKIPIIADESVVTTNDAINLLTNDYVQGVNIKLMKCGGPINFLKIFHLAKTLKKIVVLGCMYESNISLTTAAQLALALPVDFADLDSGSFDFADDPASGGMEIKNGEIIIRKPLKLKVEI